MSSHQIPKQARAAGTGVVSALLQLVVRRGSQRSNIYESRLPGEIKQHSLVMEGRILIGRAGDGCQ